MDTLQAISDGYAAAVYAMDTEAFLRLYDDEVVVFDLWENWSYRGRDAWSRMAHEWFGSLGNERVRVTFEPHVQIVDGNYATYAAYVRYAAFNAEGSELRALKNRISWVLRRRGARWFILHEHSSAPASFETLKIRLSDGAAG